MTNKEAAEVLKIIHTDENGIVREPLNMAIKALETLEEFEKAQKPKTGHWINESILQVSCSNCNKLYSDAPVGRWNYCPNCGAKMIEPQESEDKE